MNNVKRNKLWIFTEVYHPDETSTGYILTEISKGLNKYFDLTVITSKCLYNPALAESSSNEEIKAIDIIRIGGVRFNKDKIIQRFFKLLSVSVKFCLFFILKVKKGDKVLLVTNPALFLLGISFFNFFKQAKVYLIVHDVFPENALAAKLIRKNLLYKISKYLFSKAYSSFDHLLVLGRDMKEVVENKIAEFPGKAIVTVVENWADTEQLFIKDSKKYNIFNDQRTDIVFAGNIGRVQGLREVLEVFGRHVEKFTLTFIGNGALTNELKATVEKEGYSNIHFIDSLPRTEQNEFINSFDVSLVSLSGDMYGLGVPSKTYNILSCGRPILFIGPKNSEVDLLIKEFNIGWSVSNLTELEYLCNRLSVKEAKMFTREAIREVAQSNYSKDIIIGKIISILKNE